jgi:hypothetical protein
MITAVRPPAFLLTAVFWLAASVLLGLYVWLAKAAGIPTLPQLRVIHVHMALVGGVAQMIFGAMLTFIPPLLMIPFEPKKTRFFQYLLLNGGVIGMLVGFGTAEFPIVGFSGAAVGLAFLILLSDTLRMVQRSLSRTGLNLWYYGLAILSLVGGIGLGEALAFGVLSPEIMGLARLTHLHLNLIGFVTFTIVGTMQNMFPTVASARLYSDRLAVAAFVALPLGLGGLVGGFFGVNTLVVLTSGGVMLLGAGAYGWNIFRTWLSAETRSSLPVLHLLCATGWLLLTIAAGIVIAWIDRTTPPAFPIGTVHLMGYSHMAMAGFILQSIMGALSHLLPVILALNRVKSQKKRRPYLDTLTGLIERGKWIQLAALNLGTAGIVGWGLSAGLIGLGAGPTVATLWTAAGLLLLSLGLFFGKIGLLLASRPKE